MHCINDARTYMREHREIVQHCWKHAALNCESTARVLAAQSAVPPAPHAPALEAPPTPEPDAVTRANEELAALLQAISPHFNHLSEPLDCAEYISMDANLDDKIHPSCDTADILAEVAHQHAKRKRHSYNSHALKFYTGLLGESTLQHRLFRQVGDIGASLTFVGIENS